ncbi:hypothetical protein KIW84_024862 [Lathyrus oleraceus]|uniref:Transmembrane protein n=1 Tax=Pisum sativum TaxID=3888 RepID=A0A9D4YGQ6_PEA|nr:hypothetical protein KIW84_024862 [Pisum sativum]
MFAEMELLQLTRRFTCHVVLSCILYYLVAYGLCSTNGAQNLPDYDACSSFEKSYHFDSSDAAVSDSCLGHRFPAAHNSFENVCPNSNLFCFPSLLDGFFPGKESGSQYKSPRCVELAQDRWQESNSSWSSDFGVFRLLNGGVISCSLNSKEGLNEAPSLQTEIGHKNDISSCGGSLNKVKSTNILQTSSVVSKSSSVDDSVLPNIKIGPTVLDWGQTYLYSSSEAFLTVENTCNESTLHLYEPFSTDLQFYSSNFSEVSLLPGELATIRFVFFPKCLGFSSASLILQTSSGGFVVEAKGYATESPFGIQPLSGVEISPGGRLSRNFSIFNPFDEPLYVKEITAWISISLGDSNSVETEGICSINRFQVFDTRLSPTIKDRLVVKSSQVGSPIVAIRPNRKWDIASQSSETLFEMDITVGLEGKILGAFCLHLLRSSQDTSDTIMVPIEAEVDGHSSASTTVGKFVSASLEGIATCDSGEIAITISLRNDASYILSFVKVLEVADMELFHIKYKESLLLFPGTVTQVGIIYCNHLHLDSPEVANLRETCKLSILTNDSTSPLIMIPCEDILYICFEHHRLSSAGVEDKSKHIEARNMRAGYVGKSTQLPPNVKVLETSVDELVLENWKSQGTMSDKSVFEEREMVFPMIQVGSYVSRWITVKNPSENPVTVQLILNSGELINNCKGIHDLLNPSSSGNLVVDEGATPTKFGFSVPENALTEAYVHPYDCVTLGPIIFYPSERCSWSGSVLVRNNLSGVESIPLRGFGGLLSLALFDDGSSSEHVQSVDFDLKMLKPLNFSLPYSLLHMKEMTSVCSQPLVKELYVKNTGDLPLEVKSIRVSGRECGLDGFKILHCRGFALKPGESIKLTILYQTDFSAAVVHRDLELALDSGIFLLPMKASFSPDMLSNCKKSMLWMRVKKTLFGFLLIASLICFVFWFVSPQSTALDTLDFSGKGNDNLVHTTAMNSGGKTSLLDQNQRKSKLSVTNKINHLMEASCGSYSYGQGNSSEHEISQHLMQTSENRHLSDTPVLSSEQTKASESGHLVVKTSKEKGRRKKRKNLGAKLTALSEVSSSQSGNSTPSSPLSPAAFTMPKYNWPSSSDVEQPLETLSSTTSVAAQHSANNQCSVLKPASAQVSHSSSKTTATTNITVQLHRKTSPLRTASAPRPSVLSSECSVTTTSHVRAPGSEPDNRKDVGVQEAGLADEYVYDIWGEHLSLPHLLVSTKNVTHMKRGPANNSSFDSFFVRGPQTLVTNSQVGK